MTILPAAREWIRARSRRTGRFICLSMLTFTICLTVTVYSCGTKSDPADHPLTEDERYLIDAYTKIIRAQDLYSRNPARAESLFAAIDTTTDSLRIANIISHINQTPERWQKIFEVLDTRLQRSSKQSPK